MAKGGYLMKCQDLMTRELEWVPGSTTVMEAASVMRNRSVGLLLVSQPTPEEPVGVVTDRDLAVRICADGLSPKDVRVGQISTVGVVTCREDEDLASAERRMGEAQKSRLAVVDESGRIVGVLSLTDILRGDRAGRALRTANAVLAREADAPQEPLENIHLTASTIEEEEAAAQRDHVVIMGEHRGSMKEFPS